MLSSEEKRVTRYLSIELSLIQLFDKIARWENDDCFLSGCRK